MRRAQATPSPICRGGGQKANFTLAIGEDGTRQICRTDKYGFPIRHCSKTKIHKGFQTGDIVKAIVTKGKKIGTYVGRVATRKSGSFNISTKNQLVQGISHKYCSHVHRKDGYQYNC